MAEVGQTSSEQAPKDLIGFLDYYLVKKAPFQIPDNAKEWLVQYGPWITIVVIVLTLPAILALLGLGAVLLPFAGYGAGFGLLAIATDAAIVWALFLVGALAFGAFCAMCAWSRSVQVDRALKVRSMERQRAPDWVLRRAASS